MFITIMLKLDIKLDIIFTLLLVLSRLMVLNASRLFPRWCVAAILASICI